LPQDPAYLSRHPNGKLTLIIIASSGSSFSFRCPRLNKKRAALRAALHFSAASIGPTRRNRKGFHPSMNRLIRSNIKKRIKGISRRMVFILAITIITLFISAGIASAFTEADLEKLKTTKSCEGCNLRGANLSRANLSGINLSGADLGGVNLRGANLSGANLSGAKLGDAVLSDANLSSANLTGASLAGAYMFGTDFSRATWTDGTTCREGSLGKCEK